MKNRQFESIEEANEYKKRMKKEKERSGNSDDEYIALQRHLLSLHSKTIDGDKGAIDEMFFWIDSMLTDKRKASATRKKSGSQKGQAMERKIILLAIAMRRELIKDLDKAEWSLLVDEVIHKAPRHGIKDKRTIIDALTKNRHFIENIPMKRA